MNIKYKFYFYVDKGLSGGIDVEVTASNEEQARKKLDKILLPEFRAKLQKVVEEN